MDFRGFKAVTLKVATLLLSATVVACVVAKAQRQAEPSTTSEPRGYLSTSKTYQLQGFDDRPLEPVGVDAGAESELNP